MQMIEMLNRDQLIQLAGLAAGADDQFVMILQDLPETDTPPLLIRDDSKHEINPEVAAVSSGSFVKNSCIDAKGKTPLGKEESIGPNTGRIKSSDALYLNPCN